MTSKLSIFLLFFFLSNFCFGQNLVPNGNFETYAGCPSASGQLSLATPWNSARGTCDFFHSCNSGNLGTPMNQAGYQMPHSGNGYAGFFAAQGYSETREYLQVQLNSPLVAGVNYCIEFYLCLADELDGWGEYLYDHSVNNIGAYFSNSQVTPEPNVFDHLNFIPQYVNDPSTLLLTDTAAWMLVKGQFTAVGGEQYLIIGSFSDNADQDTTALDFWQDDLWTYYLIDDISVKNCDCTEAFFNAKTHVVSCYNDSNGAVLSHPSGGAAPYTYELQLNGQSIGNSSEITDSIYFNNLTAGTYQLSMTDSMGCKTDTLITLINPSPLTLVATLANATCEQSNGNIDTQIAGGTGSYLFEWSPIPNTSNEINELEAGTYQIQVTDSVGCELDSVFIISTTLKPKVGVEFNPYLPVSVNVPTTMSDISSPNAAGISSYSWNLSNGVSGTESSFEYTFSTAGNYQLTYSITNTDGCSDTLLIPILISGELTIPNIITINEDGINDAFELTGIESYTEVYLIVVSRWGNTIYENPDYKNNWIPQGLSEGVYFYQLSAKDYSGNIRNYSGQIELIH